MDRKMFSPKLSSKHVQILKNAIDNKVRLLDKKMSAESHKKFVNDVAKSIKEKLPWVKTPMYTDYLHYKLSFVDGIDSKEVTDLKKSRLASSPAPAGEGSAHPTEFKVDIHEGLNISTASLPEFLEFSDKIKEEIASPLGEDGVYVLPARSDKRIEKEPFFPIKISTKLGEVIYITVKETYYVIAWLKSGDGTINLFKPKVVENGLRNLKRHKNAVMWNDGSAKMKESIMKMPIFQGLEIKFVEAEFDESYHGMQQASRNRMEIPLGQRQLEDSVYTLCKINPEVYNQSRSLIVSIQMLIEQSRLTAVRKFVSANYTEGAMPHPHLLDLETNWDTMSQNYLEWHTREKNKTFNVGHATYQSKDLATQLLIAKNWREGCDGEPADGGPTDGPADGPADDGDQLMVHEEVDGRKAGKGKQWEGVHGRKAGKGRGCRA